MDHLPHQDDHNTIITQFEPVDGQWELNGDNIKRIDPKTRYTILHNYCKYINTTPLAVSRDLIETNGSNVNAQSNYGDTPLHLALRSFDPNKGGDLTTLTYLLSNDIDVNITGLYDYTLLHTACNNFKFLSLDILKLLIETKNSDIHLQDCFGNTPLHSALRYFKLGDDINILNYLLSQGDVNVNTPGNCGFTLLHIACENINKLPIDLFKLLIETNGADINARNHNGDTPIYFALREFDRKSGGDIAVLMYLLNQNDVSVSNVDQYSYALLHGACQNINRIPVEIFQFFIETKGCDLNVLDKRNNAPLQNAVKLFNPNHDSNINVLTYLLNQKNVNIDIRDSNSRTLLHLAVIRNFSSPGGHSNWGSLQTVPDEQKAQDDFNSSQMVEIVAERYLQLLLDGITL